MNTSPEAKQAADVEKIASNAVAQWCLASRNWTGYDMPDQQQRRLSEIMTKALAQVRAPLVAAIKSAIEVANGRQSEWGERALAAFAILDAALTGTGPQKCIIPGHPDNCIIHGHKS